MRNFPMRIPAIKIEQPLGDFFVAAIKAQTLLDTCYTVKAEILDEDDDSTSHIGKILSKLSGNQRARTPKRLDEIRRYSETIDASFPNSIILGANYHENGNLVTDIEDRWSIEEAGNNFYYLVIPTDKKMASIIDGQHRVFGFEHSKVKDMELLCSIYIDLPLAYHAKIFANININQKRVDKNLAYNLFQFDMEQGKPNTWTPETLAVYFARVFARDQDSPLNGLIKLGTYKSSSHSTISMASFIDGILSLITTDPKNDREMLHTKTIKEGRDRGLLADIKCDAPLREYYLNNKDRTLYDLIHHYFSAIKDTLWKFDVFMTTLGVLACFDFLRLYSKEKDIKLLNKDHFTNILDRLNSVNFTDPFYSIQTKVRVRIRNTMLIQCGIKTIEDLKLTNEDEKHYLRLLKTE